MTLGLFSDAFSASNDGVTNV